MRLTTRFLALMAAVVLTALSVLTTAPAAADEMEESVASKVGPSLVFLEMEFSGRVLMPLERGPRYSPTLEVTGNCTGYIVDPAGYIATAGHCVNAEDEAIGNSFRRQAVRFLQLLNNESADWASQAYEQAVRQQWDVETDGPASVRLRQPDGDDQIFADWTPAEVVASQKSTEGDNAVLKLGNPPEDLPALVISDQEPEPGEDVVAVGFPGAVQGDAERLAQPSYKKGAVSSRQTTDSGQIRTEISATLGQGMSGGPTVDDDGQVIGTNSHYSALADEKAAFNFITDNIALRSYLESHGVTLATPPAEQEKSGGIRLWYWLGPLIGVGVLVLLFLLWLLLRRKRPRPEPHSNGPGAPQFGPQHGPHPQGPQTGLPGFGPSRQHHPAMGAPGNRPGGYDRRPPQPRQPHRRQPGPVQPGTRLPGDRRPGTPAAPGRAPAAPPISASPGLDRRPPAPQRPSAQQPLPAEQQTVLNQPLPPGARTGATAPAPQSADQKAGDRNSGDQQADEQQTVLNQPLPPPPRTDGSTPATGQSGDDAPDADKTVLNQPLPGSSGDDQR
ncbi:S1 family peptidase [Gordonia iterans]|uniref:S1 family peptidase n=1 Tax=Gordonia iterans TaxID=1004901 RepID=UPI00131BB0E7|nr:serine protease [Gordonia iterans]